jgi:hypothetical protein
MFNEDRASKQSCPTTTYTRCCNEGRKVGGKYARVLIQSICTAEWLHLQCVCEQHRFDKFLGKLEAILSSSTTRS